MFKSKKNSIQLVVTNLLRGLLNNKTLIVFICISGASISSFFALSIWLNDNNNRVSTALTLFFAAVGYWAKIRYELENKSKSILELESFIESNKEACERLLKESLDKLEIETRAANTVQDKEFESIKSNLAKITANLESHLNSVGHIETEKRLSDLLATTKVLQVQIQQVNKEYENKHRLEIVVNEQEEIRRFLASHGFKHRQHKAITTTIDDID